MHGLKQHSIPCLVVHPYPSNRHATTPELQELQRLTYSLKGTGVRGTTGPRTTEFLDLLQASDAAREFFSQDVTLVPVPTSKVTVLPPNADTWPGYRIANALQAAGLYTSVVVALRRLSEVPSSHRAGPGERPTVGAHVASMACDISGLDAEHVVLVDDVLTRGSTAAACLLKLRAAGFTGSVRLLAPCYTAEPPFRLPAYPRHGLVEYREGTPWASVTLK